LVEIVDLDFLFQIPQKYARIIGGKREGASSRGSTMEEREMLKNTLETLETIGEEASFIANRNRAVARKTRANSGQKSVSLGPAPALPVHSSVSTGPAPKTLPEMVSGEEPVHAGPCGGAPGVQPGHAGPKPASR
jgi:hypothetical protein